MSSMHAANDNFYYASEGDHRKHPEGWYEVSCTEAGAGNGLADPIHALAFDPQKELIWAGSASGMLHSHHIPDMSRIVSSYIGESSNDPANLGNIRDIVVSKSSILAAVNYGLAIVTRGGVIQGSVKADTLRNPKGIALNPVSDEHVCMGGESRMLAVVDLCQQRILRQATLRGATNVTSALWAAPESTSSIAIFSTTTGRISLCDPSSMREINAIAAFAGSTTSIAMSGYYIAATGLGTRGGVSYLEPTVKIFDIRSVQHALPAFHFSAPPMRIAFDPATSHLYNTKGAMWVLSPNGLIQLVDISSVASGASPYPLCDEIQLDAGSDAFTSIAVSQHGLLALGDSGGFIHQWTCTDSARVNESSEPLWNAPVSTEPPKPSICMNEFLNSDIGTNIPKCALPESDYDYPTDEVLYVDNGQKSNQKHGKVRSWRLSDSVDRNRDFYPRKSFARFPLQISDTVLAAAKRHSFVSYAKTPHSFVRNSDSGHKKPPVIKTCDRKHGRIKGRNFASQTSTQSVDASKHDLSKPRAKSAYLEMDLVAWASINGFDFRKYNKSAVFCGLENALPNVYVNAAVQALYFCSPVRNAIGSHSCDRDWCISCELGFLFHMFDLGGAGMACEAGNFTRAFMTMANAGALGLLDGPQALPLSQRIESFTRYLLEQLHKDEAIETESTVSSVFGADTTSYGIFTPSRTQWERKARPFQHTLVYNVPKEATFCELLEHSLFNRVSAVRAFCKPTAQFESMTEHRELRSLPTVLLLGCDTKNAGYDEWWFSTDKSTRPETGAEASEQNLDEIAAKAMAQKKNLVESIRIDLSNGIAVTEPSQDEENGSQIYGYDATPDTTRDSGDLLADYGLSFVIAHVPPASKGVAVSESTDGDLSRNSRGHLVAYIRVPLAYHGKRGEGSDARDGDGAFLNENKADWWCFNDFVISPCEGFDEVAAFHCSWKKPCVIGYVRKDINARIEMENIATSINVGEVIGEADQNAAVGLQPYEDVPGKGTVLALDCEFVMVARDEADIFEDGKSRIVIPARMALARVSVIRGFGKLKGTALIDDYVAVREPVVDYLTRFSGLVEGDLDAARSSHKVSSLKSVYKRLRCLVDAGCIFVGHGLKSDFRIINFVVPPLQVIDTVTLFRARNKRLLGLRFLSNALLGDDIQSETHDSIEDSKTALRLYEMYVKFKQGEQGKERVELVIKELYIYGYAHGWKYDASEPFIIPE